MLDEALSAIDAENEAAIQQALFRLMQDRTTLILAHRLSSVIRADRILVLGEGRVVEEGPHDDLMERRGVYFSLMHEQASEPLARSDDFITVGEEAASAERDRDMAARAAAEAEPTHGILRAEGLGWAGAPAISRPWAPRTSRPSNRSTPTPWLRPSSRCSPWPS